MKTCLDTPGHPLPIGTRVSANGREGVIERHVVDTDEWMRHVEYSVRFGPGPLDRWRIRAQHVTVLPTQEEML